MAGIAGIARAGQEHLVERALGAVAHRGRAGSSVVASAGATVGSVWPISQVGFAIGNGAYPVVLDGEIHNWPTLACGATCAREALHCAHLACGPGFVSRLDGPFALAMAGPRGLFLARDAMGKAPLYLGYLEDRLCFASEVKGLSSWAERISEFPPGHYYTPEEGLVRFADVSRGPLLEESPESIAAGLCGRLVTAVRKRLGVGGAIGVWLSGGLDSAALTALACRQVSPVYTFSVGTHGSSDVVFARALAEYLGTRHYERVCSREDMLAALPEVIYHLESFDALLVRSSVLNYLVGQLAAEHVPVVLSGEGGDELFAGYSYLKHLDLEDIPDELVDITRRLHNTALQRVDRCSASHGLVARTAFLDRSVVDYALRIPADLKIRENGDRPIEKWILRVSLDGLLPDPILWRPKAKFWEGAGVDEQLATHAEETISDDEFDRERLLPGAASIATKEELLYYRIFREHFGEEVDLALVGRTKGAPRV